MGESVSVVIPTYNRRHVLDRAIDSVLAQSVPVSEVIVVDDGSTDGTVEHLRDRAAADARIRIVEAQHSGAAEARNRGIRVATGEYLAFQDSDDEWNPEFIERLLPWVAGRTDVAAFTSHRVRHRDGAERTVPSSKLDRPERDLLFRSVASTQTLLVPARLLRDRAFDPELRRFQDWELCLSLLERGVGFVHVPIVGATLYRLDDSISEGDARVRALSLRRVLRQHRSLFLGHPLALLRLIVRAYLRPSLPSKSSSAGTPVSTIGGGAR